MARGMAAGGGLLRAAGLTAVQLNQLCLHACLILERVDEQIHCQTMNERREDNVTNT